MGVEDRFSPPGVVAVCKRFRGGTERARLVVAPVTFSANVHIDSIIRFLPAPLDRISRVPGSLCDELIPGYYRRLEGVAC
jgi:hypothetical protein